MAGDRTGTPRGRPGVPALRTALLDWVLDGKPVDSVLEPAMRRLLGRHGLPPAEFHAVIGGYEVDFRIVDSPIVLECDGWSTHGLDREKFERDRTRDAELAAAGYVVLRFTYRAILRRPAERGRTHPPQRRAMGAAPARAGSVRCSGCCAEGLTTHVRTGSGRCGGGSSKGSTRW